MGNTGSAEKFQEKKSKHIYAESEKQLKKKEHEDVGNEKEKNEEEGCNRKNVMDYILSNWSAIEKTFLNTINKQKKNISVENVSYDRTTKKETNNLDSLKIQKTKEEDKIEMIKKENFYLFDESLNSNEVKHPCHAQWFLLWIYASYLNEKFNESEKKDVYDFYSNFPDQCIEGKAKNCYTQFLNLYPIKANNREELMGWLQMCENYCRKKADLPTKVFNYKKLLKRWRYDDGYV